MRLVMQIIALFAVILAVLTWWLPEGDTFDDPIFSDHIED